MLVLASASPRRADALRRLNIPFKIVASHVDETPPPNASPADAAMALALRKAEAVRAGPGDFVLGADTIVSVDGEHLGKPRDADEAMAFLTRLSGRTHDVVTGVAMMHQGRAWKGSEEAHVRFRTLDPAQVRAYVATGEPLDKAGGYGVQGAAAEFVESIDGDVTTVVGLPIQLTLRLLKEAGFPLPKHLEA